MPVGVHCLTQKTQLTALLDIYQDALPETSQLSAKQIELFRNDGKKQRLVALPSDRCRVGIFRINLCQR